MVTLFLFIGISSIKIYSIFVAEMTIKLKYIILFMILLIDNISLWDKHTIYIKLNTKALR